jgi:hypothetical protein
MSENARDRRRDPETVSIVEAEVFLEGFPISKARYDIERAVSDGPTGSLVLARDKKLGRRVALKRPGPSRREPVALAGFLRGAQSGGSLRHAGIAAVYDLGRDEEGFYVAVEALDGTDLGAFVGGRGALTLATAARTFASLAATLQYAHEQGVLHGNLKPSNIFIDGSKTPRLTDFAGKERHGSEAVSEAARPYLAPEQVGPRPKASVRTDIYGLGAVLYYALTGLSPAAPALDRLPSEAREVLRRALRADPEERYATMAEMQRDLDRLSTSSSAGSDSGSRAKPGPASDGGIRPAAEGDVRTITLGPSPSPPPSPPTAAPAGGAGKPAPGEGAEADARRPTTDTGRKRRTEQERQERAEEEWRAVAREREGKRWKRVVAALKVIQSLTPDDPRLGPELAEAQKLLEMTERRLEGAEQELRRARFESAVALAGSRSSGGRASRARSRSPRRSCSRPAAARPPCDSSSGPPSSARCASSGSPKAARRGPRVGGRRRSPPTTRCSATSPRTTTRSPGAPRRSRASRSAGTSRSGSRRSW